MRLPRICHFAAFFSKVCISHIFSAYLVFSAALNILSSNSVHACRGPAIHYTRTLYKYGVDSWSHFFFYSADTHTHTHTQTLPMHRLPPACIIISSYNKKHLKNVGPIRHNEPPHANSPDVDSGTVARRLRIDVHDNDDNAWQRGPLWPHEMGPITGHHTMFHSQISFKWYVKWCWRISYLA